MQKNLIANLLGSLIVTITGVISIPIYIKFLGTEAYGLIGFYITLNSFLSILDMGFSATMVREMAWLSNKQEDAQTLKNLAKTLEILFWCIAILCGILITTCSPFIAKYWINNNSLSSDTISRTVMLMGVSLTFHLPMALYNGGLTGLQKLIPLNIVLAVSELAKLFVLVLTFSYKSPSIELFFYIQIIVITCTCLVMAFLYWKSVPKIGGKASFDKRQLARVKNFSLGMTGISIVGVILGQMDKVVLIKLLPLKEYGYYILAVSVASLLYKLTGPIFQAVYPRLVQLVSVRDVFIKTAYHQYCQLMAVLLLPIGITIFLFPQHIIFLWTHNFLLSKDAAPIARILIIGTTIQGMMFIPYALQLAYGLTRLPFLINLISICFLLPALFILTNKFGAIGGAMVWLTLNIGYLCVTIPLTHKYVLKKEMLRWYLEDTFRPAIIITGTAFFLKSTFISLDLKDNIFLSGFKIGVFIVILYLVAILSNSFILDFFKKKLLIIKYGEKN